MGNGIADLLTVWIKENRGPQKSFGKFVAKSEEHRRAVVVATSDAGLPLEPLAVMMGLPIESLREILSKDSMLKDALVKVSIDSESSK